MPTVDREALRNLIGEADLGYRYPEGHVDLDSDEVAAEIVAAACQKLSAARHEDDLSNWFFYGLWLAGGAVGALYANERWPVGAWYDWPLVWVASTFLFGIALLPVIGLCLFAQDYWWRRFGRGKRDAAFYGVE